MESARCLAISGSDQIRLQAPLVCMNFMKLSKKTHQTDELQKKQRNILLTSQASETKFKHLADLPVWQTVLFLNIKLASVDKQICFFIYTRKNQFDTARLIFFLGGTR